MGDEGAVDCGLPAGFVAVVPGVVVDVPEGVDGVFVATALPPPRPMNTKTRTAARMASPPIPTDSPITMPVFESEELPFLDFFLPPDRPPPAGTIICPWQAGQGIARPACWAPTLTGLPQ